MKRLRPFLFPVVLALTGFAFAAETPPVPGPLTREAFVAALTENLTEHFHLEGEMQLDLLRPWSPPAVVARVWSVEVVEYPSLVASAMLLRCHVLADGQLAGDAVITLNAAVWRNAWAAREPLQVNTTFDASLLTVRRIDCLRERDALPASLGDDSFIFTHAVQPGRLLSWRDISRRPLVRKGDVVEVAAIDGQLQITMQGLAMESGAQGDTVIIRNPESRKDFTARVVAQNRVQIRF